MQKATCTASMMTTTEDEIYFDREDDARDFTKARNKTSALEGKMRFSPTDGGEAGACCSSVRLLSQTERMRTTRRKAERKVDSQFYKLNEYDNTNTTILFAVTFYLPLG